MKWILQTNIFNEDGFDNLLSVLQRLSLPYSEHKVVPFVGGLDPDPVVEDGRAIVMGSYSMARQAVKRGWKPGAFLDNLDFTVQREHWGKRMLNYDAEIYRFEDVPEQNDPFFIRPVHDTKAFTGFVEDYPGYMTWRESLQRLPETVDPVNDPLGINLMTVDTPVMVCKKKEIYNETRVWVVNGRVITCSGYKMGTIKRYLPPERVDRDILWFAQGTVNQWAPNDAFVIDIADTPEGLKVIEVNNINSAGFYKGDLNLLVMALEDLEKRDLRRS